MAYTLHCGDCLDILPTIPAASIDAVLCDPPYPEISRDYGRMTEDEWWAMMMGVCTEVRRVLKPTGSAVFILQANGKVGSMRGWLWEFMAWVCRDWNMVQDAYWWNFTKIPTGEGMRRGLMKDGVKPCVWCGPPDCYRDRSKVLWEPSDALKAKNFSDRALRYSPSGIQTRTSSFGDSLDKLDGVVPFNLLPIANSNSVTSSGASGHGAGTPLKLADWWTRYIVPPGGTVLDPFNGAGTMGVAALQNGARYIGIEKMQKYVDVSRERLAKVQPALMEVA
jgi:DNA modification methylase